MCKNFKIKLGSQASYSYDTICSQSRPEIAQLNAARFFTQLEIYICASMIAMCRIIMH